jgi:toxin ParE1/3/4
MRVDWTADALADFEHISTWIEKERTLALANRMCRRIYDAVQALRRQPSLGRSGRVAGTRELVVTGTPWTAVYRINSDVIQLLRILHGAQDWPPSA